MKLDAESLQLLAEAVDTLRIEGYVSLRSISNALNEALVTREPAALGFAQRSFEALDGGTRQEIAQAAIQRAYELAQRHSARRKAEVLRSEK